MVNLKTYATSGKADTSGFVPYTGGTTNIIIAHSIEVDSDSEKLLLGDGQDASLYYDGTDLIIDPQEVGSGTVKFLGNITFETTSDTIAGVENQNLVDKSATETISGDWNFTNEIHAADGTEALPSYTFNDDINTGMYRIGPDNIGFATVGNEKFRIGVVIKCSVKFAYEDVITLITSATPDVRNGNVFEMDGARIGGTIITNFTNATEGQMIIFRATNNNVTIANGINIQLQGSTNFAMSDNDVITLMKFSDKWMETSRMTV